MRRSPRPRPPPQERVAGSVLEETANEPTAVTAAEQEHDTLVKMIARRIGISTWVVSTNRAGEHTAAVPCPTAASGQAFPDIVAHERFTRRLAAVGEVETERTLSEARAAVWAVSAKLAPRFFLYVPEEQEAATRAVLQNHRIRP